MILREQVERVVAGAKGAAEGLPDVGGAKRRG